jgi:hypothetical protein
MMFIGVIHCEPAKLREVGLENREEARHLFYNRAKDLYDADYESNSLIILQTMFLLSFWRAGPLLQKDSRYWLSGAISLAQTKAMHRSFGQPDRRETKLRKRLWWSIYVRDRQCAAALGLPNRIRDEDCDIEPLTPMDLENPDLSNLTNDEPHDLENILFPIEMTKLACSLGKIVHKEYMPNSGNSAVGRALLKTELNSWAGQLPEALRLGNEAGGLFMGMLHIAYNNLLILLHRSAFIAGGDNGRQEDGHVAYQAACRISRVAEDLLAEGLIGHGQIHLITCLFNALCIHTINLRRVEGTSRLVAEHRAKICLYGLRELQKTWEVTNWILQLFFQYLDRSMARRLGSNDHEDEYARTTQATLYTTQRADPPNGHKFPPFPASVNDILGQNEPESQTSLSYDGDIFERAFAGEYGDFPLNSISNLDGITPIDLELLASCLT